jgi:type IV pilus assembly protein PilN
MIRINLLPAQQRARISHGEKELLLFVLLLAGLGLGMHTHQKHLASQIQHLKKTEQTLTEQNNTLKAKLKHIQTLQTQYKTIQQKIDIIKDIRQKQSLPVRYLDLLIRTLPEQKMWFESLQMNPEGTILLRGIAMDNQVFAKYIQRLRNSSLIQDIILKQTSKQTVMDYELIAFQCQIQTRSNAASSKKS